MSEKNQSGEAFPTFPCDEELRQRLIELRATIGPDEKPRWSNSQLSAKLGCSTSVISQWLAVEGNLYSGNIKKWEKSAEDFLRNEARRSAGGVTTRIARSRSRFGPRSS